MHHQSVDLASTLSDAEMIGYGLKLVLVQSCPLLLWQSLFNWRQRGLDQDITSQLRWELKRAQPGPLTHNTTPIKITDSTGQRQHQIRFVYGYALDGGTYRSNMILCMLWLTTVTWLHIMRLRMVCHTGLRLSHGRMVA